MALNKYSSSRRFTKTTTGEETEGNGDKVVNLPEVTVSGRKKLTAEQRNDIAYEKYKAKQKVREGLVASEKERVSSSKKDIENYEKFVNQFNKANPESNFEESQRNKMDFSKFAGGGKIVGSDALEKYNQIERSEGRPTASKLYRPGDFEDDDAFIEAVTPKGTRKGAIHHSIIDRPSLYSERRMPEIDYPEIEESLDRMDVNPAKLTSRRKRVGDIDISDNRTKYVDPDAPDGGQYIKGSKPRLKGDTAKNKRKQNRAQFFENLITPGPGLGKNKQEGTAGRFKNMGERRRYRQEEDEAKATYGRGFQGLDTDTLDERKEEAKYDRRRALATFNIRAAMDSGKEIRDARKAKRYSARQFGNNADKAKYFTKDVMKDYRSSEDNPLNRNTTFGRRN